jgi:cbb3-type cytochrome oxidase maturation protein
MQRLAGKAGVMNVLIYLVPIALTLGLTGLAAFLWSLRNGQYDDVEGAALRVLSDDDLNELEPPSQMQRGRAGFAREPHRAGRSDPV